MEASHKTHRPHIKGGKDEEEEDTDGPLGKRILSNIQSTLFLHRSEVVPSSYLTFYNFEKNIRINIFIAI